MDGATKVRFTGESGKRGSDMFFFLHKRSELGCFQFVRSTYFAQSRSILICDSGGS